MLCHKPFFFFLASVCTLGEVWLLYISHKYSAGDIAQLVERRLCEANVRGSSPLVSTTINYHITGRNQLIYYMNILDKLKKKAVKVTFWVCLVSFFVIALMSGKDSYNSENFLLIAALCLIEMKLSKG